MNIFILVSALLIFYLYYNMDAISKRLDRLDKLDQRALTYKKYVGTYYVKDKKRDREDDGLRIGGQLSTHSGAIIAANVSH